jgi:hypothetical protein
MKMYFIPILADALSASDPAAALREALVEIKTLGALPENAEGYAQFQAFVAEARRCATGEAAFFRGAFDEHVKILMESIALQLQEGGKAPRELLDALRDSERWQAAVEACRTVVPGETNHPDISLLLERYGDRIFSQPIGNESAVFTVTHVEPGDFTLRFDSGQVLWQGAIDEATLLWHRAHPREPLRFAAATPGTGLPPTRTILVLGGLIELRLFPGLETGWAEIRVQQPGDTNHD